MPETRVIHINRAPADWKERPDEFVYIGRAVPRRGMKKSPFANQLKVGKDGTRLQVVEAFDYRLRLVLAGHTGTGLICSGLRHITADMVRSLHGKTLVCWCAPAEGVTRHDKPWCCHGQVLAQIAAELSGEAGHE